MAGANLRMLVEDVLLPSHVFRRLQLQNASGFLPAFALLSLPLRISRSSISSASIHFNCAYSPITFITARHCSGQHLSTPLFSLQLLRVLTTARKSTN